MAQKRTYTLGVGGDPCFALCRGHLTAKEFSKAHRAEGWRADAFKQDEIRYEYWQHSPEKKTWRRSLPGKKGAVKVTIVEF